MADTKSRLGSPFWSAARVSVFVCLFLPATFFCVLAWPDSDIRHGSEAATYQGLAEVGSLLLGCLYAPVLGALAAVGSIAATAAALRDVRASRQINHKRVVVIACAPALLVGAMTFLPLMAAFFRKQPGPFDPQANAELRSSIAIYAAVTVHVAIAGMLGARSGTALVRRTVGGHVSATPSPDGVHLATERGRVTGVIVALLFVSVVGPWALAAIDVWFAVACSIVAGITGYALGSGIGTRLAKEH